MDDQLAGSIAGAAATVPMTAVMAALHRILPEEGSRPLPPRTILENAIGPALEPLDETAREGASMAAHFGFGAAAGAGYSAFAGQSGLSPAVEGALYGVAVWGGAYLGVMPASGLYRPATEDTASRNLLMISAHVVWGAAMGLIFDALASRRK